MWLSDADFRQVVEHTPLVSLDFVISHPCGNWLLGRRLNRPAQGSWFVPGGRLRKNETLDAAAHRLTHEELGHARRLAEMRFLGVYQHFYADSMFDTQVPTHYLVLAYHLTLDLALDKLPRAQHGNYRWWTPQEIASDDAVHPNTCAYLPAVTALASS